MRVFLTGATGFLGRHLLAALVEAGHTVRVLHRASSDLGQLPAVPHERAEGDITRPETLQHRLEGCDACIHTAGVVSYWRGDLPTMERVNHAGTVHLLDAARAQGVRRFVHTSSVVAVGCPLVPDVMTESYPFPPASARIGYCATKRAGEAAVLAANAPEFATIALNPTVIFGPRDPRVRSGAWLRRVATGRQGFYPRGGISIVDVLDIARVHVTALTQGRAGSRYLLGGENLTLRETFARIAALAGVPAPRRPLPTRMLAGVARTLDAALTPWGRRPPITPERIAVASGFSWTDCTRARLDLDFTPRGFEETARRALDAYRERGWL